jgi:hypothetical protein
MTTTNDFRPANVTMGREGRDVTFFVPDLERRDLNEIRRQALELPEVSDAYTSSASVGVVFVSPELEPEGIGIVLSLIESKLGVTVILDLPDGDDG